MLLSLLVCQSAFCFLHHHTCSTDNSLRLPPTMTGGCRNRSGTKGGEAAREGRCSSTVSQYSECPTPQPSRSHTHSTPACHFPKTKEKEAANIFAALRGERRGRGRRGGSAARQGLATLYVCLWSVQDVCVRGVYGAWRQGYHSARQNTPGSPSGRSCQRCTAALQRRSAASRRSPCRAGGVQPGEELQTRQHRATIALFYL